MRLEDLDWGDRAVSGGGGVGVSGVGDLGRGVTGGGGVVLMGGA